MTDEKDYFEQEFATRFRRVARELSDLAPCVYLRCRKDKERMIVQCEIARTVKISHTVERAFPVEGLPFVDIPATISAIVGEALQSVSIEVLRR